EADHLNDSSIGRENELPNFPLVSDIARKNVLQADSDITLRTAANLMIERDVSSIVFRKNERLHVFSMEKVLEISHADGCLDQTLSLMPIEPATTIEKDKNVLDALDQLELAKTRFLIVIDPEQNNSMVGILTYS
ncbi:CBS domain-containing protein, partial [bacterium]|nr:CBS domain-containing protein [bacterium]